MEIRFADNFKLDNLAHDPNAALPIEVTLSGIVRLISFLQLANAKPSMETTPSEKTNY